MRVAHRIEDLIGSTPLIDLSALQNDCEPSVGSDACEDVHAADACNNAIILGKYEATNPGGSIKDRVALAILDAAETSGSLAPGGTIIEPTSGNTGVGLAMIAAQRGYKLILTMPDTMSIERRKLAAAYGAEIVLTPGAEGMSGSIAKAEELHKSIPGSIIAGQFDNPANPQAHYESTGPEIWNDTEDTVDVLVAGAGTGGTISGTAKYLKEQKPEVYVVAVEPAESAVLSGGEPGAHGIQGIGAGFVPRNYDASVVDEVLPIASSDAMDVKRDLSRKAGLLVGISAGAAVAAALQLAQRPEFAGKTIVAILPDTGERYLSVEE
ncbi:cysteine synthase A [Collinsella provencensis]|uniref:cysteine synthase A n=1 Tax=Collinsella provencensis TaxID=1937461 RepID=UPI000C8490F3|nr:cysteine synthase A [Collinsella provencensis]